ncbi:glycosyltransferase family 4 protein [Polaribacter sp. Q13]|uniref:glycosyltransferase family 4 protein n=1 Tax=Polaribacter sp. Q13 TaxID=2806551 RepID=UPI00193B80A9|nr:glycosyltransferase family 4 protein [Polaribacter sp. Q13]QVY66622.1 glycosyltransferase family 4 protein [Polaribacter sp. Q13]
MKSKVFHIITHFDMGGAERVAINIAKSKSVNFEYHLFEIVRANSEFSDKFIEECKANNIHYHRSNISSKKLAILFFPITFLLKCFKIRPNIIHTHTEIPDLSVFLFSKLAGLFMLKHKYVRTIHNTQLWNEWGKIGAIVEPFFIKKNSNVAISTSTKHSYKEQNKVEKLPIIFNGVEKSIQKIFPDIKNNKINILFAGRLEYQKGVAELISVINALKNDNRFHFHIIGEGSLEVTLLNATESLKHVSKYDKIFNLSQYLESFDYLFMPSNFEGLGLMCVEANMNRLLCIINNCLGLKETLPNDWLLKVENNSIEAYLNIFNEKIQNIDKEKMIDQASKFANENFSLTQMQEKYEALYIQKLK